MMKTVRLLPLLAVAAVCLFMLKFAGLLLGDGYILSGSAPAEAQAVAPQAAPLELERAEPAPAQPQETGDTPPAAAGQAEAATDSGVSPPEGAGQAQADAAADTAAAPDAPEGAEKNILASLAERRKQLEARARELELRENLIRVAEDRVEVRIKELKAIEQRIESQLSKRDQEQEAEYEKLVSLYAKMKPKDAARIFEQMDVGVLARLIRRMNARTVSPIMAEMDPVMAKRVSMEIASSSEKASPSPRSLPKISSQDPG